MLGPVVTFVRGMIWRALSCFLTQALNNGGWRESLLEAMIGSAAYFSGGVILMLLGLLIEGLVSKVITIAAFGICLLFLCLPGFHLWAKYAANQLIKIQGWAMALVILVVGGIPIFLEMFLKKQG